MNTIKEKKKIVILFSVAITLMVMALLTMHNTMAIPNHSTDKTWNISIQEIAAKEEEKQKDIVINNDRIDFLVSLTNYGEEYSFIATIKNEGDYDAYLAKIENTNLSAILVGKSSSSGKTYTMADYVSLQIKYLENNTKNKVVVDGNLQELDNLYHQTANKIQITVKYRDRKNVTDDQIEVMNQYIKENNLVSLDLPFYVRLTYQQLK